MSELDKALSDISSIRSQLAAGTLFRGFGPAVMAVTGCLALLTALLQSLWPATLAEEPYTYLACWSVTAVVSACLIGAEMFARSRRHHGGLADTMVLNAVEQFVPAAFAGAVTAFVLFRFAPHVLWLVPGLWQMFAALGIFAGVRILPRIVMLVGAWYFLAGATVLILASSTQSLDPWMMGVPFAAGQFLMAAVLRFASQADHDED